MQMLLDKTFLCLADWKCGNSNIKFGEKIVYHHRGSGWNNHAVIEVVSGENNGLKISFDPISYAPPLFELKEKVTFLEESFKDFLESFPRLYWQLFIYHLEKDEIIEEYPCGEEINAPKHCFAIRGTIDGDNSAKVEFSKTLMSIFKIALEYTFKEKLGVRKICPIGDLGDSYPKSFVDHAFKIIQFNSKYGSKKSN